MSRGRIRGAALIVSGLLLATPLQAKANACPGYYCPYYEFFQSTVEDSRWPSARDGTVRVEYYINPNHQIWLTKEDVRGAVAAAADTWMRANPRLRLIFKGFTNDSPIPLDGKLVIGWWPTYGAAAVYGQPDSFGWHPQIRRELDPVWYSTPLRTPWNFDIWLNPTVAWEWAPCKFACPPYRAKHLREVDPGDRTGTFYVFGFAEFQSVMTHEFGHVLGLNDINEPDYCPLTMVTTGCFNWPKPAPDGYGIRYSSTLGLGDILGLRALYPFKCPTLKKGQRMPSAYAQVCPIIKIFTP